MVHWHKQKKSATITLVVADLKDRTQTICITGYTHYIDYQPILNHYYIFIYLFFFDFYTHLIFIVLTFAYLHPCVK